MKTEKSTTSEQSMVDWEDLINEKQVLEKFDLSVHTLRNMRNEGKIKNFHTLNGRKFMYSKKELMGILFS